MLGLVHAAILLLAALAAADAPDPGRHLLAETSRDPDFAARRFAATGVTFVSRVRPGLWWVRARPGASLESAGIVRTRAVAAREKVDPRLGRGRASVPSSCSCKPT